MISDLMGSRPGKAAGDEDSWFSTRRFALLLGVMTFAAFPDSLFSL